MQKMQLYIAIPSYNRPDALRTILAQLSNQKTGHNFCVVVLNDGGNERSEVVLSEARSAGLNLVYSKTNEPSGLPSARNKILDTIDNLYKKQPTMVVFLDDDCEVDENFVDRLYEAAERYDGFSFAIETVGRSGIINTKHNPFLSILLRPFLGKAWLKLGFLRGGYFLKTESSQKVDHIPGGCLAYRYDKYPAVRFDPKLNDGNAITEDTDFSVALRRAGARLMYCGYYGILHRPPSSGGVRVASTKQKYYYYWRNKSYLCKKWEGRHWLPLARIYMLFEAVLLGLLHRTWLVCAWYRSGRQIFGDRKSDRLSILAPLSGLDPDSTLGGEVYDAHLLSALSSVADVRVILPEGSIIGDSGSNWKVSTFKKTGSSLLFYYRQMCAVFAEYRKQPFDVLWVHSPYSMTPFMLMCKILLPNIKVHAQFLHRETSTSKTLLSWLGLRYWDSMSSCSGASVRDITDYFGIDDKRFVVAYPGLQENHEEVSPILDENGFTLLHVGSLIPRKNVSFLIDVVASCESDVRLVILGGGSQRNELEQKAATLGLADRVTFLGRCSEEQKHQWMKSADVLVLASLREGFGMVVTESATHGTPSLVSDKYSLPEVVIDGQTGLVRPLQTDVWVEAITNLKNNPEQVAQLGNQAKKWTAEQFSWSAAAENIHKHLTAIV